MSPKFHIMNTTQLCSAACMAAGLLFLHLFTPCTTLAADAKSELSQKKQAAQEEYDTARRELESLQAQQNLTEQHIDELNSGISALTAQLDSVYNNLLQAQCLCDTRQAEAAAANRALVQAQDNYNAAYATCKEQMAAMQLLDGGGRIGLLMQADSLYDLLTIAETMRELAAANSAALQRLQAETERRDAAKAQAENAAAAAEEARRTLQAQQEELQAGQDKLQTALLQANDTLQANQAAAQAQSAVTEAARQAYLRATAELDAYARAQSDRYTGSDLHLTSLAFRCPLDSYTRITTQFGEADPWGIPHRGTDFAAPNGTPVYAIADGIVSAASTRYSYGNCVQISHGTAEDGCRYDSLYAHLSSFAVAQGDTVTKGQIIGYVGNTGNVYSLGGGGYHLHLELRTDGQRTNPLQYVPQ